MDMIWMHPLLSYRLFFKKELFNTFLWGPHQNITSMQVSCLLELLWRRKFNTYTGGGIFQTWLNNLRRQLGENKNIQPGEEFWGNAWLLKKNGLVLIKMSYTAFDFDGPTCYIRYFEFRNPCSSHVTPLWSKLGFTASLKQDQISSKQLTSTLLGALMTLFTSNIFRLPISEFSSVKWWLFGILQVRTWSSHYCSMWH